MSIIVRSESSYRTEIHIRQHTIIADELVQDGGSDEAPTPIEMLIGTIGACVAVTTRAYARRKNWQLEGITVEVEMTRFKCEDYAAYNGEAPYVNEVRERIHFEGALTEEQKVRLMSIASKCPVHLVLENPVFFHAQQVEDEMYTSSS